jgi:hypothetical protein
MNPRARAFGRNFLLLLGVWSGLSLAPSSRRVLAAGEERGTLGVGFGQLYSDGQENKRGPLVVLRVVEGLPGDRAGIKRGDIVVAVNGTPVAGRELADIIRKDLRGGVGGTVRLTIVTPEGSQSEVALTRVPYPPHISKPTDPFAYVIPGTWATDPRYSFPLPWAPAIPYGGGEDLAFSPNFDDTASPEYHSYIFFWWLEGPREFTAEQLQADMTVYFQGLAKERGSNYKFTPDLTNVSAKYAADPDGPQSFGGAKAKPFRGEVHIYDTHGQVIALNSEVVVALCPETNLTAAFFAMSREPHRGEIWKEFHAIRDSFRCKR